MRSNYKEILELNASEKILLVEEIWDSIVSENAPEVTSLTNSQKNEVIRRLNLHKTGQTKPFSWHEVKSSLKK